jgi:hypothetical protein
MGRRLAVRFIPTGTKWIKGAPTPHKSNWWFCRKVRFLGQNPKIGRQEFNGLQTHKLSKKQLCDRTIRRAGIAGSCCQRSVTSRKVFHSGALVFEGLPQIRWRATEATPLPLPRGQRSGALALKHPSTSQPSCAALPGKPPSLSRVAARHLLRALRLARYQLDRGCRQGWAAAAGAAELGHHLFGEEGHLRLDLGAAQARHLEVA